MCIRDRASGGARYELNVGDFRLDLSGDLQYVSKYYATLNPVSYTHLRAHETVLDLVCRLLLEKTKEHSKSNDHEVQP